jgi:hypothetical protein
MTDIITLPTNCSSTTISPTAALLAGANSSSSFTSTLDDCGPFEPPETAISTKIVYALWIWCIFLTFPGTYSMQPAVTTQTFGHK